jgi:hypothetical protein
MCEIKYLLGIGIGFAGRSTRTRTVVARFVVDEVHGILSSAMRFGSTTRLRVSSVWFG